MTLSRLLSVIRIDTIPYSTTSSAISGLWVLWHMCLYVAAWPTRYYHFFTFVTLMFFIAINYSNNSVVVVSTSYLVCGILWEVQKQEVS